MSIPLIINGLTFQYPQEFDTHWGPTLTNWSTAVTNGMLQTSGVNAASLIKSATVNPSATGFLRLAKTDFISWRNNANSADLPLAINGSNQLTFNGSPIGASTALTNGHIFVGNVSNQPADVAMSGDITITNAGVTTIGAGTVTNAKIIAAAGIAVNKLAALTASKIVVTDGSGFLTTVSSPSLTELGYLTGVTSAIQTQLNSITGSFLPLSGGTMSGVINMGSNKITSITQGSNSGEAISFPVNTAQIATNAVTNIATSASGALSQAVTVTTVSITTTGNPVLLIGQASISGNSDGTGRYDITLILTRSASVITGGRNGPMLLRGQGATTASAICGSICTIDTPGAGTYTYQLTYSSSFGSSFSVDAYSLQAIEIKK